MSEIAALLCRHTTNESKRCWQRPVARNSAPFAWALPVRAVRECGAAWASRSHGRRCPAARSWRSSVSRWTPGPRSALTVLSEADFVRSLEDTLRALGRTQRRRAVRLWALIGTPALRFAERRVALVRGWQRCVCRWLRIGRGSPEHPGARWPWTVATPVGGAAFRRRRRARSCRSSGGGRWPRARTPRAGSPSTPSGVPAGDHRRRRSPPLDAGPLAGGSGRHPDRGVVGTAWRLRGQSAEHRRPPGGHWPAAWAPDRSGRPLRNLQGQR
ncbi:cation transport regulator ChaC [Azospirillum soli]|nr:cation transport regulator ChaC [Azospirillum soli]